ncbi:MAG TPA: HEAT repeat domain-containing protein [Candidatus Methanoperedens sp.]
MINVIEKFAYYVSPIGPWDDYDARQKDEKEWVESLTIDDAFELLAWVKHPSPLPGWHSKSEGEIAELRDIAAQYVGRLGRRLRDDKIRISLEALLVEPSTRSSALQGLAVLGDIASVPAVSAYADEPDPVLAREIVFVLEELGSEEAFDTLERMYERWKEHPLVGGDIRQALHRRL